MAKITDARIAEQAEYVDGQERELKQMMKEPKARLKESKAVLAKLLAYKRSGQMTFDPDTGEVESDTEPINAAIHRPANR